jgi:hypothetical protein
MLRFLLFGVEFEAFARRPSRAPKSRALFARDLVLEAFTRHERSGSRVPKSCATFFVA